MTNVASQPDDPLLDAPPDIIQYRSLSVLAVLTFILGVFSLLALISPVLWVVPLCAIAVGMVALRAIYQDSQKSGERLAKIGMLVAMCIGLWAVSYHFAREWYLFHTAKRFADQWLEVVQDGKLMEAHQLHLPYLSRYGDKDKLEEYYDSMVEMEDSVTEFFGEPPLNDFVKHAGRGTVTYAGRQDHTTFGKSHFLTLKYLLSYEEDGPQQLELNIQLERVLNYSDGRHYWRIETVTP
jgi:hypothetical protein